MPLLGHWGKVGGEKDLDDSLKSVLPKDGGEKKPGDRKEGRGPRLHRKKIVREN